MTAERFKIKIKFGTKKLSQKKEEKLDTDIR